VKITALRLFNVKRFAGRGVAIEDIGDGVNVLCAANEFGKSTSFEALHALFFQPHSGQPKDVRRLQPYSGGNPIVEADIVADERRYRLAKQFIGGRRATVTDLASGRLVAQADEAEAFIAGLTRGGTSGPAGLLWVRQGVTGIEDRDRREEEDERRVRASLLESVQGEVEAVTGGRRMAEVLAACSDELGRLVTAGQQRPKGGGPYEAALAEERRLAAEEARLSAEVAALRKALDDRAAAQKQLADADDPEERAARRAAVMRAEAAFDAARAHGEAAKAAEAESRLAETRRDAAVRDRDAFRAALDKAASLRARTAAAAQRCDAARARHRSVKDAAEAAAAAMAAAEADEREKHDLLSRLNAALAARQATAERAALATRLEQAEALRDEVELAEARLALLAIPAKSVERLQALEATIAGLEAVEAARRPMLSVAYEPGASVRISLDGEDLADGAERGFAEVAQLSIPGIGAVTLRANRPADGDAALREKRIERDALLAKLGVPDLAAARAREAEARRFGPHLDGLRARLVALAPDGLAALREAIARAGEGTTPELELKGDPDAARRSFDEARARLASARVARRETEPARERAEEALRETETALAVLRAELAQVETALGPEDQRPARVAALEADAHAAAEAFADADSAAARLRAAAPDLENAAAVRQRVRSAEEAANRRVSDLRETIALLDGAIRARTDEAVEEVLQETREALAAARNRVAAFEREVAVLNRLQAALQTARSAARDLYLKPVMTELRPLLALLFDDLSITFDEKTLLPHRITRNGAEEDVERLSGGTREQLSVLTRLAFARLLARDGRPAPVILDDALVYSDDDRIEKMFDALHRQSREQQIIVFSCRQRAFARLGGKVLTMVDWRPAG
jgi:hypothetical protein